MSVIAQPINQEVVKFDEKKLALIRNTFCKDATQEEFEVFIEICKNTQLNPLFKQIYFIKRGGKPTHQTSIDGLRLIADRTKRYMPGRESTFTYDPKSGALISATSYVKKLAHDGSWHEVGASAIFKEYNAGINLWKTMPHVMLAKCAEAIALRKAFPADMLGLYSQDEMDQADAHVIETNSENTRIQEIKEDCITSQEAQEIEFLLHDEDKSYRDDLLKYFSNARKLPAPMTNFYGLPKIYLAGCINSIQRRKHERQKKETVAEPENAYESASNNDPF